MTNPGKTRIVSLLCVTFLCVLTGPAGETAAEKAARMQWWLDARFGMFIHWGPVSLRGTEIGWSRGKEVPAAEYDTLYRAFNPVKFNARQWVSLAKKAGMRYITLVTKHHDGFSMFNTRYSDYSITHTPFGRDVTKELAEECRRQGVRFCAYYSIIDWYHPDYLPRGAGDGRPPEGADFNRYVQFMKNQLRELIASYGPIGVLWFDGYWESTWSNDRAREIYSMLRELQPDIIVNNRLTHEVLPFDGGMAASGDVGIGDFGTPEQETGRFNGNRNLYWESCMTICQQWSWKPADRLKTLNECISLLERNAGADGNFLLNISPMPDGRIEPRQARRLAEVGAWMKKNGESIYGTRGGPFKPEPWGVSTCKDSTIYVHMLAWPAGSIVLPPIPRSIVSASVLGGGRVHVKQNATRTEITIPRSIRKDPNTVIVLRLDGPAMDIAPLERAAQPVIGCDSSAARVGEGLLLTIASPTAGATIRYTLDGSEPSETSARYAGPFTVTDGSVVRAVASVDGMGESPSAEFRYAGGKVSGLAYRYYEGNWQKVPDMDALDPLARGVSQDVRLEGIKVRPDHFAVRWDGFVNIQRTGVYTFTTSSDDGTLLYIDGRKVVDNDGSHSQQEQSGKASLTKGMHRFRLDYFDDTSNEFVKVFIAGPGERRREIPAAMLFHDLVP